ncbi:MAG: 2-amino-4-hydroxy-6-hydroxymethyldihydropteridine diphosphokinase [Chitinivibrionales bacterium]|nr:2-amino-4-hydroxy-6-hydroxymethyldihydropteridine diphosphokinase [Chitinivibrionales bacterium]
MSENQVFLSCGGNIDDRGKYIDKMIARLSRLLLPPVSQSRIMETEPVGVSGDQKWYFNVILGGKYTNTLRDLLQQCRNIEIALGRKTKGDKKPRTADIDILLFDGVKIDQEDLVVPHPGIVSRRFCLEGLYEIASDFYVPGANKSVAQLYASMDAKVRTQKIRFID